MEFTEHEQTVAVAAAAKEVFANACRQAHPGITIGASEVDEGWELLPGSVKHGYRAAALPVVLAAMAAIAERPTVDPLAGLIDVPDTIEGL